MPVKRPDVFSRWTKLAARFGLDPKRGGNSPREEPPIGAKLYSVHQLELHAQAIAGLHRIAGYPASDRLIPRLSDNERVLLHAYDQLTEAVKLNEQITPAAEWLLDNFYVIEEQVFIARRHFPRAYSEDLPQLANGPAAGMPRVYGIAMELISHVDGRVDAVSLDAFIAAYQTVAPLTLGELWAIPIMLRVGLIENLRRVTQRLAAALTEQATANAWAARMVRVVEERPNDLVIVLADMARANPPFTSVFVAELMRHLHGQSQHFAFVHSWIEHRVSEEGLTIDQLVQMESHAQAAAQISLGNSITSLRFLSASDWPDFVEKHSNVEKTLREDPSGIYAQMNFHTRNNYRAAVESIARRGRMDEAEVARAAIGLAKAAHAAAPADRTAHVGYCLVDGGREELKRIAGIRATPGMLLRHEIRKHPLFFYMASALLLSGCVLGLLAPWAENGGAPAWVLLAIAGPLLMSILHLALALVNWLATLVVPPRPLPRLEYRDGIPPESRSIVAMPAMLGSSSAIDELLERIEIHYIANRDPNLHFALLTGFKDANEETLPSDEIQLRQVMEGIEALNRKYASDRTGIFFLFHRSREWNPVDQVWMEHERKRGKLSALNEFLLGSGARRFSAVAGDTGALKDVRYVITLDSDTELPRDAARAMAGAMAHPLNRPELDAARRRVVQGYGILQPRVAASLPTAYRSWYARLFAGEAGLDPYTRIVSDVYQDCFGEGSFIGKGIYDIAAFHAVCGYLPDNTVLSHDLLEGTHARSALLTDVELFEGHPSSYAVDAKRRHRWVRGDWQILHWLLPRVPARGGTRTANPISALSWWKIFDNLRRSLVAPSMLFLFLMAWVFPWPPLAGVVTLFVVATLAAIPAFSAAAEVGRKPPDITWRFHLRAYRPALARRLGQILFTLAFIPYEAYLNLDAIARTVTRMFVTRRNMLEWTTSSDTEHLTPNALPGYLLSMIAAPLIACLAFALIMVFQPDSVPIAAPLLVLWLLSPIAAWYLSQPIHAPAPKLSGAQTQFLRKLSRKTWRFFEVFVNEEENWLPPDNFQEWPAPKIAARTSPTNLGMALLANLSASDFGYQTVAELLQRSQDTLSTMARLERYRGHFYNWYDTRSLAPLPPYYVSTVDSGNLAMHLLVLQQGLLEAIDAPIIPASLGAGMQDTLAVFSETIQSPAQAPVPGDRERASYEALRKTNLLAAALREPPVQLGALSTYWESVVISAKEIAAIHFTNEETRWWAEKIQDSALRHRDEFAHLAPWTRLATPPDGMWSSGAKDEHARNLAELRDGWLRLDTIPTLREVAALEDGLLKTIDAVNKDFRTASLPANVEAKKWLAQLRAAIVSAIQHAAYRIRDLEETAVLSGELATMDFAFLYDERRDLMSIGYNITENRLDAGVYDLLASEARAASYFAISQGQLEQEHWFALRRSLTTSTGLPALLSWNGSMFEYLMPLLVMPTHENTLLNETYKAIVQRQIVYGKQQKLPWGVSESGYYAQDLLHNFQYRGFGVPGLGLKRGLVEDRVVAPYATMLALMVCPEEACRNLERLAAEGREGAYGFYEAIDYTASRLPPGTESKIVPSFMVHHQGMGLLSLAYLLLDRPMQRRFLAEPAFRATELLLHERVPRLTPHIYPHAVEVSAARLAAVETEEPMRVIKNPNAGPPEVHLLSNGNYHVMVSGSGGGYVRWHDLAVTRWREDPTRDCWGPFCYLRDLESHQYWSTSYQPVEASPSGYEAVFVQGKAEFRRRDEKIDTHTEISVSPEDDIELRRTTITNRSERTRQIEITSYAEVVLAPAAQDQTHPAFSNLFVQTELLREQGAILCTRRPRSAEENPPWMTHLMTVQGETQGETSFETSRLNFIGRGRSAANPDAMEKRGDLSGTEGCVLDPVVAIRRVVRLRPNESARVDIVTGVTENRNGALALAEKYHDARLTDRVFDLAWTHSQVELRHINATESDAQLYLRLAGAMIYTSPALRAPTEILMRNRGTQAGLWAQGISGDLPILLIRIRDRDKLDLVRQALQAHAYWRAKGFTADLVIWNEDESVYRQELFDTIMNLVAASPAAGQVDQPGGIFVRRGEQMSEDDRVLLKAAARVMISDDKGTLREQVERRTVAAPAIPEFKPMVRAAETVLRPEKLNRDLAFFNGTGGFTRDGREYITILEPGKTTPAPWSNVLANPNFGSLVSESGTVYTWSENCHEFRLTPWYNDPVGGDMGEAVYLRDEESGRVWSPTPLPARGKNTYRTRHGFGYSVYEYEEDGIVTELTMYVAMDMPVKFSRIKIRNRSGRPRRVSATAYWEIVLGELRSKTLMHVVTEQDKTTGAIFARNAYSMEFGERIAFFGTSELRNTVTADRSEFLGRNGSAARPRALRRARLSGRTGAGFDPCAVIQAPIQLEAGEEKEIVFFAGATTSHEEARNLVQRARGLENAQHALDGVWHHWSRVLGAVYVETPDLALNFLVNGWLMYQTLACRMWARTGFYQSGGAFGFRDQLQDSMALIHAAPGLTREHLLRAAARQFLEGDVQHWWHPQSGRGVRTHFSDDYLWLPYAACRYVRTTGDTGVLDENVPFLEDRPVRPEEEAYYDLPRISGEHETLYEHCVRAVRNGLRFGRHGLPLMGCGDWNDGMNLVGEHGEGESVWLAFFLYDVLMRFSDVAEERGDTAFMQECREEAAQLRHRIEKSAWDGQWYRRAYFDNGKPLGSAKNEECRIDSIAQSWSVLSGAGKSSRTKKAMNSVDAHLVRRDARLIQLFDPPFDQSKMNPGYIKGYTPGVRENGGQYTHAAIWTAMAFAAMNDAERAWETFSMLNPVTHGDTPEDIQKYRVEPYVVAADVYGAAPHTGRGGWTWYTGSSSWMYRLITESLLGLNLEIDLLRFRPCLPAEWESFKLHYRYRETFYHIELHNGGREVKRIVMDGAEIPGNEIRLVDDHNPHNVELWLG